MKNVLILGGSGMLGSMVADVFSRDSSLRVKATVRFSDTLEKVRNVLPDIEWKLFDVGGFLSNPGQYTYLQDYNYIVNCIGITKPYCNDNKPAEILKAVEVNALFPNILARELNGSGTKILQIATDCVYSGKKGIYIESDKHDALDVYGKTKSLGESKFRNIYNLRCSIIGPEFGRNTFLIEWFLNQPQKSVLNGYTNHKWNGITTLQFARICLGIIKNEIRVQNIQHIIPRNILSKYEMLKCFSDVYNRNDLEINTFESSETIDRTLGTSFFDLNNILWSGAGYNLIPSLEDMITELSQYDYKFRAAK